MVPVVAHHLRTRAQDEEAYGNYDLSEAEYAEDLDSDEFDDNFNDETATVNRKDRAEGPYGSDSSSNGPPSNSSSSSSSNSPPPDSSSNGPEGGDNVSSKILVLIGLLGDIVSNVVEVILNL